MQSSTHHPCAVAAHRFGIGTFYTILDQLFKQLFSGNAILENVRCWMQRAIARASAAESCYLTELLLGAGT